MVRAGGKGANDDWDMFYVEEDDDPNTYNSSRAVLDLPANSRVTYARLYPGGNLRVSEQKPPKHNGRILIAEPGGRYKAVLADTRVAHRDTSGSDVYQASADVTPLVCRSGSGLYTVAQISVLRRAAGGAVLRAVDALRPRRDLHRAPARRRGAPTAARQDSGPCAADCRAGRRGVGADGQAGWRSSWSQPRRDAGEPLKGSGGLAAGVGKWERRFHSRSGLPGRVRPAAAHSFVSWS